MITSSDFDGNIRIITRFFIRTHTLIIYETSYHVNIYFCQALCLIHSMSCHCRKYLHIQKFNYIPLSQGKINLYLGGGKEAKISPLIFIFGITPICATLLKIIIGCIVLIIYCFSELQHFLDSLYIGTFMLIQ